MFPIKALSPVKNFLQNLVPLLAELERVRPAVLNVINWSNIVQHFTCQSENLAACGVIIIFYLFNLFVLKSGWSITRDFRSNELKKKKSSGFVVHLVHPSDRAGAVEPGQPGREQRDVEQGSWLFSSRMQKPTDSITRPYENDISHVFITSILRSIRKS